MTSRPTLIVAPTEWPISLAEARSHLREPPEEDNNDIQSAIEAATEVCQEIQSRAYFTQTLEITLDYWPCGSYNHLGYYCRPRIELPRATPLQSVTSIIYKDENGTPTTWSAAEYIVDYDSTPGGIVPATSYSWPSATLYPVNAIRIRYVAGHGAQSPPIPFPARMKRAMLWLIGHFYENREAVTIGTLMQSEELKLGVADMLRFDSPPNSF